ncbi:MAG: hypothetical protein IJZ04_05310 [Clostridia bacterium]|nr:hypothetical protein [Clostridia bacterium]MBQ8738899.1 hypothetical protein [Clostridia bacterium]
MTIDQVREELKDVKQYYSRKGFFDRAKMDDFVQRIKTNAEKYDRLVLEAPTTYFNVYDLIYRKGKSQFQASIELSYAKRTVERLHSELVGFFVNIQN